MLLAVLLFLAGASSLMTIGLTRSASELLAASRHVQAQQAFHLAEAALDEQLTLLRTGAVTSVPLASLADGTYEATVTADESAASTWRIEATGSVGAVTSALRIIVQRGPVAVPGATVVVGEAESGVVPRFFFPGTSHTIVVDGCDLDNPGWCLPGLVVTTQTAYDHFAEMVAAEEPTQGFFGNRLVGATSDYSGTSAYSIQHRPQAIGNGGLDYEMLISLATFAKAKAQENGCYFDYLNDDSTTNDDPATLDPVVMTNRTFGTTADPKICYVEAPFKRNADGSYASPSGAGNDAEEVWFTGNTHGAGLLVVKGEADLPSAGHAITYEGVIVSVGPTAESDFHGDTDIQGAVIIGTTEPYYDSSGNPHWMKPDYEPSGSGRVQFSSAAVEMALGLLEEWVPPHGPSGIRGVSVRAWHYRKSP